MIFLTFRGNGNEDEEEENDDEQEEEVKDKFVVSFLFPNSRKDHGTERKEAPLGLQRGLAETRRRENIEARTVRRHLE